MSVQKNFFLAALLLLSSLTMAQAVEVGNAIQVTAGSNIITRNQTWASIAWAKESKCWMIVWREGFINEGKSELWCARISAEGKALDPDGIRLTTDEGLKDMPKIASDGKDFFITWDDFRNGQDWDLYGVRVSGKGVVLDTESILIADGAHNQCRSAIAFAKGRYVVLWMGFGEGEFAPYGMYFIYGASYSPDGKRVGEVVDVSQLKQKKYDRVKQGLLPAIATNEKEDLLSLFYISQGYDEHQYIARQAIDPKTGGPLGGRGPTPNLGRHSDYPGLSGWFRQRTFAIAMGKSGAMIAGSSIARLKSKKDAAITQLTKKGEIVKVQELESSFSSDNGAKSLRNRPALAFNGKSYLVITDVPVLVDGFTERNPQHRAIVVGWEVSENSEVKTPNSFLVAGEDGYDCLLPTLSAGPKGKCLVVYTAVRGVDKVKLMARLVE